jgi:drug/metabolite transporter (DMT)-like permease
MRNLLSSRSPLLGSLALFTAAACWGGTYVSSKYALEFVGPFTLVLTRYGLASLVFLPLFWASKPSRGVWRLDRSDLTLLAITSFIGLSVSSWAQFFGTALSSAHAGALITSSAPAFMVLFGAVILAERVTLRKIVALAVATFGVAVVVGPGDIGAGTSAVVGDLLLVVAGITWALYSVLIRRLTLRMRNLAVTAYVTAFGAVLGVPLGVADIARTGLHGPAVWLSILYIGFISTALAYYLWNKGLELLDAGTASVFFFAQPLTGTFFSWLLLGERLTPGFFAGGALIMIGVAVASFGSGVRATRFAPPAELAIPATLEATETE